MQVEVRDLAEEISLLLEKSNHPNPRGWKSKVHPDALTHEDENIRRFQINQFWRSSLGRIDISGVGNTIGERFFLTEDGSTDNWLRLFEMKIVDAILKYKLEYPTH